MRRDLYFTALQNVRNSGSLIRARVQIFRHRGKKVYLRTLPPTFFAVMQVSNISKKFCLALHGINIS